jgi:hypothetical protein
MSVRLIAILFNHETQLAATDGLNIRRNFLSPVRWPEWETGITVNAEDSLAAYSIRETFSNRVTVQARFASGSPTVREAEIRAVPVGESVLGELASRRVVFNALGDSGFVGFELTNHSLWSRGVGVYYITWRWQMRTAPGRLWTTFAQTQHKIYLVLERPTAPWTQFPFDSANTQLPWTEVMDYACRWSAGTHSRDAAAGAITTAVNALGEETIEYGCAVQAGSHYITFPFQQFECTRFLERLRGGLGRGRYVNCTDCAAIVSTFANVLGCDLWQSRMSPSFPGHFYFAINPILAIGSGIWQTACEWPGFSFHEVAWKGGCTSDDALYDACLRVDRDPVPQSAPHTPLLPLNIRFGRPGERLYREHLATTQGMFDCEPQPSTRIRRSII